MQLINKVGNITIELSSDELVIIKNALNESFEAIEPCEFSTRMGAEIDEVENLLVELSRIK